jgi:hypothetical protein
MQKHWLYSLKLVIDNEQVSNEWKLDIHFLKLQTHFDKY